MSSLLPQLFYRPPADAEDSSSSPYWLRYDGAIKCLICHLDVIYETTSIMSTPHGHGLFPGKSAKGVPAVDP